MATDSQLPKALYKYRSADDHLLRLISHGECWMSPPSQLNDPFEVTPLLQYRSTGKNTIKHAFRRTNEFFPKMSPAWRIGKANQMVRQLRTPTPVAQRDDVGIYSLTEIPTCTLMWAHYGDNHKGVCLEFDTSKWLMKLAQRVAYREDRPIIDTANDKSSQFLEAICATKAMSWEYEAEWRILSVAGIRNYEHSVMDAHWQQMRGPGMHLMPNGVLTGIIFGLRCPKETEKRIVATALSAGHQLSFSRMQEDRTKFLLHRSDFLPHQ